MAPQYDRSTQDVGNIVEFGHVNVTIPDQRPATDFYIAGLGLTRDPYLMTGTTNMWANVGRQQFHLPEGPAQVVAGVIGLVLPDLDALRARLERVRPRLAGTRFSVHDDGAVIEATCPWGNRIRCHAAGAFGRLRLGIAYVDFAVSAGAAAGIARFYRDILHNPATLEAGRVIVPAGTDTVLIYTESDDAPRAWDGNHIQISLADFSGPHAWLEARGLITEESDAHQYRFNDIVDVEHGGVLVQVEHEVRSMRHPLFARGLTNRNALQTNQRYAPGWETEAWALAEP